MGSAWRSLLTWLLVLAMPLQGLAAIGVQHCAPTHRHADQPAMAVQAVVQDADRHAHRHMHQSVHQPAHQPARGHAGPAAEPTAVDPSALPGAAHALNAGHASSSVDAKCSACAACCVALGLPDRVPDLPALADRPGLAPSAMAALTSFVPGGLDRPPRSGFA
jgi:hypothetical protein